MRVCVTAALALALTAGSAYGQALYTTDAKRDPGARSWALERASLPPYTPPLTSDGHPDLRGRWGGTPGGDDLEEHEYRDVSSPPEESFLSDPPDGRLPYQAWALEERAKIRQGLGRGWPGETARLYTDPQTFCLYSVPRATTRGGFEILQGAGYVLIEYGFGHFFRMIPIDGRPRPVGSGVKLWMGRSTGSWDGNTLVVDVTNLNGRNWLDQVGNFISEGAHITERFALASPDIIDYTMTVDDPAVFTRPWTVRLPIRRVRLDARDAYANETWENACHEGNQAGEAARGLGFQWFRGVSAPR